VYSPFFLLLVWHLFREIKYNHQYILSQFYAIYYFLGMMVSSIIITSGALMIEINEFGTPNGIFWILLIFFMISLIFGNVGFKCGMFMTRHVNVHINKKQERFFISIFLGVVVSFCFYVLIKYSGPIFLEIDRVQFWNNVVPEYLKFLHSLLSQTYILFCFLLLFKRDRFQDFYAKILFIILIIIIVLLLGEKFSAFILLLNALLVIRAGDVKPIVLNVRILLNWILVILFISALISLHYADKEDGFGFVRVALQGQLLWSVLNDSFKVLLQNDSFVCFFECGQFSDARDFISYKYLPFPKYDYYQNTGTNLSGFMPAVQIMIFGLIAALLLHSLVSFLLGFFSGVLVKLINSENIFYAFILFKILFSITIFWYTMLPASIFSVPFFLFVVLSIVFPLLGRKKGVNFNLKLTNSLFQK